MQLPTWLSITPTGDKLSEHFIYDDGPTKTVEETDVVSLDLAAGTYSESDNGKSPASCFQVTGYDKLKTGRGDIILTGATTDNDKPAETRITMTIRRNLLSWIEEVRPAGSTGPFVLPPSLHVHPRHAAKNCEALTQRVIRDKLVDEASLRIPHDLDKRIRQGQRLAAAKDRQRPRLVEDLSEHADVYRPDYQRRRCFFLRVTRGADNYVRMFLYAGLVIIGAGLFDMVDGRVARQTNQVSVFGAFFDSVLDRYSDVALFFGLLVFYARGNRYFYVFLVAFVMTASLMVSYTRARAEALIGSCKVGFMERPERIVLVILGALCERWGAMAPALWVLARLPLPSTVIHRIRYTYNEDRAAQAATGDL